MSASARRSHWRRLRGKIGGMDNDNDEDDLKWLTAPVESETITLPIEMPVGYWPRAAKIGIRVQAWAQLDGPSELIH